MTEFHSDKFSWEMRQGDALSEMSSMPADSVDTICTSPPYWGQRDYGVDGQLGLELTPVEYLDHLWAIFDGCRRVLKPTGCCFVVIDDTYAGSFGKPDVPNQCRCMIPERFAWGMIGRGWWLRNDGCWQKPNSLPESVKRRFSCTWEHVYYFTKSNSQRFDLDAIRIPVKYPDRTYGSGENHKTAQLSEQGNRSTAALHDGRESYTHPFGKNPGDVFTISTVPFPSAHFAVYPPTLIRPLILSGCPPKVCVECGKPWERIVEEGELVDHPDRKDRNVAAVQFKDDHYEAGGTLGKIRERKTIGWQPTCECGGEMEPGTTLDPFSGAGTTGLVCVEEDRNYIGIELSAEYCEMQRKRLEKATRQKQHSLFS